MQEYIDELKSKVGLTAEQAKKAIETIVAKVKTKVPESFHGSIDGIFSSAANASASASQRAEDFAGQAEEKLKAFGQQAREQLSSLAEKAEDMAGDVQQKAEEAVKDLGDKFSGLFGKTPTPEK
jgi:hypothetical protein